MPDPLQLILACVVTGIVTVVVAVTGIAIGKRRKGHLPSRDVESASEGSTDSRAKFSGDGTFVQQASGLLAVCLGFLAGVWMLSLLPAWPPSVDRARLIWVLIPLAVVVELVCSAPQLPRPLVWGLRLILAAVIAPVILFGSVYFSGNEGFGSGKWSAGQATGYLALMGAAFLVYRWLLSQIYEKLPNRIVVCVFFIACASSGVAIMLSGYLSAGQLLFPLSATLVGLLVASLVGGRTYAGLAGGVSLASVILLASLLAGHFFARLEIVHAVVLAIFPLGLGLLTLPYVRSLALWMRIGLGLVISLVPELAVLIQVQSTFVERSSSPSSSSPSTPSIDDYRNYGQ